MVYWKREKGNDKRLREDENKIEAHDHYTVVLERATAPRFILQAANSRSRINKKQVDVVDGAKSLAGTPVTVAAVPLRVGGGA